MLPSEKLFEEGKYEKTIHHCVTAITESIEVKELAEAYSLIGRAEYALTRAEKSVASLAKCLQANAAHYKATFSLGMLFFEYREQELAVNCFHRANTINPCEASPYLGVALA